MKRTLCLAAALTLAASAARAQEPAPAPGDAASALSREQLDRIMHIRQIESMLTSAVKAGAASLAQQLQVSEPNLLFVTSNPRTRGFELEGYGVFFDVDVPSMMPSMVWSRQALLDRVDDLKRMIALSRDDNAKRMATFELRRTERMLGLSPAPLQGFTGGATSATPAGIAVAATTDATPAPAAAAAPPMRDVPALPRDARSPNELYTDAIKTKLIDTMLTFGGGLGIADSDWLTIAARATSDATPGQLDDGSSIVIRIKGSDLNAYLQRRITRDEVMKKIEIKEG